MAIRHIEEAKELRKQFDRLGRAGISERALYLINEFKKNNDGNYKEVTQLIGRFHALWLAIGNTDYWAEIKDRGYTKEFYELKNFIFEEEKTNV